MQRAARIGLCFALWFVTSAFAAAPPGSTPEELSALMRSEIAMFAKLVKQIGYQPQ